MHIDLTTIYLKKDSSGGPSMPQYNKRLPFNFPILKNCFWGWSQRERKYYPRENNLFILCMEAKDPTVVKKK